MTYMITTQIIGTPLQSSATKVLMLGAGELGKEVVISLMRLGVEVHAADRYANAPAMQVAHTAHVLDMTDAAALTALINQVQPALVVPEIEAIATEALVTIEKSGTQVIPTARATLLTMNRKGIRKLAAEELGLPTSHYQFASNFQDFKAACESVGFPCFVKPVMSSSGKGQSRLSSADDIENAWQTAINAGRVKQADVIIEAQVDFDFEITLLTCRAKNPHTGAVQTHFCDPVGHRQQDGDYVESWQPQRMTAAALAEAQKLAQAVTDNIGGLGIFGVELFVKGDKVWFSEVSPRPHDTGLVTMATQYQSEFELHARAILGLPVDTSRHCAGASAVVYGGVNASNITYAGVEQVLAEAGTDIRLFSKPESFTKRRMGVVTARAATAAEAREKAKHAVSKIVISHA